jgi:hypothetical protein
MHRRGALALRADREVKVPSPRQPWENHMPGLYCITHPSNGNCPDSAGAGAVGDECDSQPLEASIISNRAVAAAPSPTFIMVSPTVRCVVPECRGISHADPTSGRSCGTDTSRLRQDHVHRPSCDTAIEGFDQKNSPTAMISTRRWWMKWRKRNFIRDAPTGLKTPHSTVLSYFPAQK